MLIVIPSTVTCPTCIGVCSTLDPRNPKCELRDGNQRLAGREPVRVETQAIPLSLEAADDRYMKLVQLDPAVVTGGKRIEDPCAENRLGAVKGNLGRDPKADENNEQDGQHPEHDSATAPLSPARLSPEAGISPARQRLGCFHRFSHVDKSAFSDNTSQLDAEDRR